MKITKNAFLPKAYKIVVKVQSCFSFDFFQFSTFTLPHYFQNYQRISPVNKNTTFLSSGDIFEAELYMDFANIIHFLY